MDAQPNGSESEITPLLQHPEVRKSWWEGRTKPRMIHQALLLVCIISILSLRGYALVNTSTCTEMRMLGLWTDSCWLCAWVVLLFAHVRDIYTNRPPPTIATAFFIVDFSLLIFQLHEFLVDPSPNPSVNLHIFIALVCAEFGTAILGSVWPSEEFLRDEKNVGTIWPDDRVCPLSWVSYEYLTPLLSKGFRHPFRYEDTWLLPRSSLSENVAHDFYAKYVKENERLKHHPHVFWWLLKMEWRGTLVTIIMCATSLTLAFAGPYVVKVLVAHIQGSVPLTTSNVVLYVSALFWSQITATLLNQRALITGNLTGVHWRSALVSLVYRKAMRLSSAAKQQSTLGQMTNLVAVDAEKIRAYSYDLTDLISCPIQILAGLLLLFNTIGPSALAGVSVMVCVLPLNVGLGYWYSAIQRRVLKNADRRLAAVAELIKSMRTIKMHTYESLFTDRINTHRLKELTYLRRYVTASGLSVFVWTTVPVWTAVATFGCYILVEGKDLDAVTIFGTIATFGVLRMPLNRMPEVVVRLVNVVTSLNRIEAFLALPERPQNVITTTQPGQAVEVCNASVSWEAGMDCVLSGLDFKVPVGQLLCVVGPTGGGKTALALAMLGEMQVARGSVGVAGRVAYVSQQAWIMAGTIRENILFGSPYDAEWYEAVVRACCLVRDLQQSEAGDATEIGEKGINMSGGQRQRINLARAVYSRPSVLIMDDPLSAVDAHVAKHIFSECCLRLLKGTTRVLVTHALGLALPQADNILLVQNNSIREQGTLSQLLALKGHVYTLMQHLDTPEVPSTSIESHGEEHVHFTNEDVKDALQRGLRKGQQLIGQETQEVGRVALSTYRTYARAMGTPAFLCLCVFAFAGTQAVQMVGDYWTSWWATDQFHWQSSQRYLVWYLILGLILGALILMRTVLLAVGGVRASGRLHEQLLLRVVRARMRFFDTNPMGRIMNRFAKDMQNIDIELIPSLSDLLSTLFTFIGSLIIISMNTPWFMVLIGPVSYLYFYISVYYQNTARELKRYDSTTRSPIYSHFSESVDGTVTIRAYGQTDRFWNGMCQKIDANSRAYLCSLVARRWLAVRLETLGALLVAVAGGLAVWGGSKGQISAGTAGLVLTSALKLTQVMTSLVRVQAEVEMAMNGVERVREYSEIPEEPPAIIPDHRPPPGWPKSGEIEVRNLVFRYAPELPPVLKGVSLLIGAGEKVGIVGRTGAGKSSLMLGLFRIADIPRGSIVVDGVDITTIGVQDLRRGLGIIPQEPVLFTGTIRSNLDPFCGHSDRAMWEALHATNMGQVVGALPLKLDAPVTENGENLSVGQRQLLCLARAVLHQAKVLVLDEATASVDFATDACIQKTIRTVFRDATVLAVAHRLQTVIDYHRIAVLDSGLVREYDDPLTLISDPASTFHGMCRDSGEFDSLLRCAQSTERVGVEA